MELRHLRLIDAVAREGSLSMASRKLHLTQSALSHQLKELEAELGILMFNRANKKLEITEAGNIIRRAALKIQQEIELATTELDQLQNGSRGEIRLSTECYTCYHWLPGVLHAMEAHCKDINIHVLPEFTKRHFEGLLSNELDLVITSLRSPEPDIGYKELFRDEQLLITSLAHTLSTRAYIEPEDLRSETLLIYNRPIEDSTFYTNVLKPAGITPKKLLEIRLTEAAIQLVKSNIGVKVMARWAAEPYLANGDVAGIKIGKHGLMRKWYLAYNRQFGWKHQFDVFKNHLVQHLGGQDIRHALPV